MTFIFKTETTMKPYNGRKWWICSDCVSEVRIEAENITDALEQYREHADKAGIEISKTAIKNRQKMYRDGQGQIGYVITGKTIFNNDYKGWVEQYIELWIEILTVDYPFKKTA